MVGAGAQDLDHVLNALPRLTNTVHSYLDRLKMISTNFFNITQLFAGVPDPDPIRIRRIRMFLDLLDPDPDSYLVTNGSGSGSRRPKTMWIRWIRIRILQNSDIGLPAAIFREVSQQRLRWWEGSPSQHRLRSSFSGRNIIDVHFTIFVQFLCTKRGIRLATPCEEKSAG